MLHPKVQYYQDWINEMNKTLDDLEKIKSDWEVFTEDIEAFQKKVDKQIQTLSTLAKSPNTGGFTALLQEGIKLMPAAITLSNSMTLFYNILHELNVIEKNMMVDITEEAKEIDPHYPEWNAEQCRKILYAGMALIEPMIKRLNEQQIVLTNERKVVADIYNLMIQ